MVRQRLRIRVSPIGYLGDLLVVVAGGALVWYGLMLALLGLKASPRRVDQISGYRTIYDYFAGLEAGDITDRVRLIAGLAGLATFLLCAYLAWKKIPRPYLARSSLDLYEDELTTVSVEPRAIERAAEVAASQHPAVSGAAARYGGEDGLNVSVAVDQAREVPGTVYDVRDRVDAALAQHDLPQMPVNVTLTGFDRKHRRELK